MFTISRDAEKFIQTLNKWKTIGKWNKNRKISRIKMEKGLNLIIIWLRLLYGGKWLDENAKMRLESSSVNIRMKWNFWKV